MIKINKLIKHSRKEDSLKKEIILWQYNLKKKNNLLSETQCAVKIEIRFDLQTFSRKSSPIFLKNNIKSAQTSTITIFYGSTKEWSLKEAFQTKRIVYSLKRILFLSNSTKH